MTTARKPEETMEQYRERQKVDKMFVKYKKRGYMFWDSKQKGTYVAEK